MVLSKSFRVWRKYRPRSVLLETKENPEEALLFETNAIAILCKTRVGRMGVARCVNDWRIVSQAGPNQLHHRSRYWRSALGLVGLGWRSEGGAAVLVKIKSCIAPVLDDSWLLYGWFLALAASATHWGHTC